MTSVLEEDSLPLSQILDLEAFREVCKSFSELYGIGIKVFEYRDHGGQARARFGFCFDAARDRRLRRRDAARRLGAHHLLSVDRRCGLRCRRLMAGGQAVDL